MKTSNATIADICEFIGGSQPPKSAFLSEPTEGYVRLIQTRDYKTSEFLTFIPKDSTAKFCNTEDIMIGRYGPPIFQICRGLEGAYNVALMKATPRECIRNRYLYYLLKQPTILKYVQRLSLRTGGQTGVDLPSLQKYPVKLPSLDYQLLVDNALGDIDDLIELNNQISRALDAMARLLYAYWFVQFDFPITAAQAAAMGNPRLKGKPYRASGGKMKYDDELQREVPFDWKVGILSDTCHLNQLTWETDNFPEEILYVDLSNAKHGRILQPELLIREQAPSRAQRILRPGDTIVGTVRPENCSYAWVPRSEQTLTGSTGFAVLSPVAPTFREFNYLAATSPHNIKRLTTVANGAAYPAVNPEVVAAYSVPLPGKSEISLFHEAVSPLFELFEMNETQNRALAELRDWLLPMLMNGQVTVT